MSNKCFKMYVHGRKDLLILLDVNSRLPFRYEASGHGDNVYYVEVLIYDARFYETFV